MTTFKFSEIFKYFTNIKAFTKSYDPTYEHLIYALKYTIPNVSGILLFIYLDRPFSSTIYFVTSYIYIAAMVKPKYKSKISDIFLICIAIACAQFLICIFKDAHVSILIISIFILTFFIYATDKHRAVADVAPMWIAVSLSADHGWVTGVNQIIEMFFVFIIAVSYLYIFEYFTAKLRIKASIIYIAELIYDSFYLSTIKDNNTENSQIYNKHLLDQQFDSRADAMIESFFTNRKDKFFHKVIIAEHKTGVLILDEEYYFSNNKAYVTYFVPIYYIFRKLIRDITILMEYRAHHSRSEHTPSQSINVIENKLKNTIDYLRDSKKNVFKKNINIPLAVVAKSNERIVQTNKVVGFSQFLYALDCITTDLDILENLISRKLPN